MKRANGSVVTTKNVGLQPAGSHAWTWGGRDSAGAVVVSGAYSMSVDTTATVADEVLVGQAVRSLVVDKVNPTLTGRTSTYPTVYPFKDGYRDTTSLSVTVSEKTSVARRPRLRRLGPLGVVVDPGTRGSRHRQVHLHRAVDLGQPPPCRQLHLRFQGHDPAGNVTTSPRSTVKVSAKKLSSARTATRTLTGEADHRRMGQPPTETAARRSTGASGHPGRCSGSPAPAATSSASTT